MKETITRSLTGIAIIALIVLSLHIHPFSYLLFFSLACIFSWLEFARMYRENIKPGLNVLISIFLAGSFFLSYLIGSGELADKLVFIPFILLFPILFLTHISNPGQNIKRSLIIALGIIYLLAGFTVLNFMAFPVNHPGYTPTWILFTFYFLWMNDSMAYVSGRLMGKNPIWPAVSPGKTWEGSIGGAIFSIVLAIIFSRFFPVLSIVEWIGFAVIVILFGSLGDFFESWLKRKAGVKDSGKILPGHGGILDRLDSLLLSAPFITLYLYIIL